MISFTVSCKPTALQRHRTTKSGHRYDPSANDKAVFLARANHAAPKSPFTGPVRLVIAFFFQRPKSHYRTGKYADQLKPNAPRYHTNRPDIDNIIKFIGDSLNGVFWSDDAVIAELSSVKMYDVQPRIDITVMEIVV